MQQVFEFPIAQVCSFDNFISCDGNALALQFARRLVSDSDPENLLYIHGPSGSGKTHLLTAIAGVLGSDRQGAIPCFSFRDAAAVPDFGRLFSASPLLLIDDLHLIPDSERLRSSLWQVFNDFHSSGRRVALAGLYPPRELPNIDDHLVSRLLWGLLARVDVSDDHSRLMILKKLAHDRQVRIPDEVCEFILVTTSREAGDLIRTFDGLCRYSLVSKRKLSLALARECREFMRAGESV